MAQADGDSVLTMEISDRYPLTTNRVANALFIQVCIANGDGDKEAENWYINGLNFYCEKVLDGEEKHDTASDTEI